ncbi:MAG: transcriptional repressor LexA [Alphaproteobacteria bacterium]|nr:transcriptional repressor LexA [Alphaproteobacteria bacterium]
MLTKKQYDLLQFIDNHLKSRGVSPSFDEMKDALGLKSKSGIHRLITGLEERGFIRRLPHRARALEVIQLPDNLKQPERINSGFTPNVIEGGFNEEPANQFGDSVIQVPLYGRIAAGLPIEAVRDDTATTDVPAAMLGRGDHYALEVQGGSMIDAGIHDGDIAVIERLDNADNGAIIVALVDENEVTLKRLRRKGQSIALEPANEQHETRIFGPDRVKVQGRLKAILRQY